jgi:hypothetical protein
MRKLVLLSMNSFIFKQVFDSDDKCLILEKAKIGRFGEKEEKFLGYYRQPQGNSASSPIG